MQALWFGWSPSQFALLSVFNVALSIGIIAVVGLGASILNTENDNHVPLVDRVREWARLLAVAAVIVLMLTTMFGWLIIVMAPEGGHLLASRSLWSGALSTLVTAVPIAIAQLRADAESGLSEERRKQRDQPKVGVLFLSGIIFFALSSYAASWFGTFGLLPLMIAITGFLIFSDLRPDLLREALRPPKT